MVFEHVRKQVQGDLFSIGALATLVFLIATLWPKIALSDGHLPSENEDVAEIHAELPLTDGSAENTSLESNIPESGEGDPKSNDILSDSGDESDLFRESDDLDTDIGALEEDLMNLNMELRILEEDILYPASSRIAVYLAMDTGQLFQLDSVTLKLNNKEVSHHLYTERQVAALHQGGIQRLYVGNARQGDNELTAVFIGKGPEGRDYTRATAIDFDHGFEPIFIQLSIMDDRKTQQPEFAVEVVR
ncbi:MAG: hypothetical protein AAF525_01445 [Pseudomonadota bacterium]